MNKSFVGIISCLLFTLIIAGSQVFAETKIQYRYKRICRSSPAWFKKGAGCKAHSPGDTAHLRSAQ